MTPEITRLIDFSWWLLNDGVCDLPLPTTVGELKTRTVGTWKVVRYILHKVWRRFAVVMAIIEPLMGLELSFIIFS
jgi:hypothetical protein